MPLMNAVTTSHKIPDAEDRHPNPPRLRAKAKSEGLQVYELAAGSELRDLIRKSGLRHKQVCHELNDMGIRESVRGLSSKLIAGTFSAAYFLAVKKAVKNIRKASKQSD